FFHRAAAGRQFVMDSELPLADHQFIAGMEEFLHHPLAVDLDAVGAVQVADGPVAVAERQLAMRAGYVRKRHVNVALVAPADDEVFAEERNGVAATGRDQFTVGFEAHECSLWTTSGSGCV